MTDEEIIKKIEILQKKMIDTIRLIDSYWGEASYRAIAYDSLQLNKLASNEIDQIKTALSNRSEIKEGTDGTINDCYYSLTKIEEE